MVVMLWQIFYTAIDSIRTQLSIVLTVMPSLSFSGIFCACLCIWEPKKRRVPPYRADTPRGNVRKLAGQDDYAKPSWSHDLFDILRRARHNNNNSNSHKSNNNKERCCCCCCCRLVYAACGIKLQATTTATTACNVGLSPEPKLAKRKNQSGENLFLAAVERKTRW